jgi:protein phosphatase
MSSPDAFNCIDSERTDVGMVRQINEDACLSRPEIGLWVVADGMGGHSAGDVASGKIVEQMAEVGAHDKLSALVAEVESRLLDVNDELREIAAEQNISTVGSTVAALVIKGRFGMCLWVGDSRVYRVRGGEIEQLTQDHAFVEDLVEKGILSREDAANHPQSNLVTRAVGAQDSLKLDLEIFELRDDDLFIVCSDGLDKEVTEAEIAATSSRHEPTRLSDELVGLALARGSRDNVTVISVKVQDPKLHNAGASAKPARRPAPEVPTRDLEATRELSEDERTDFRRLARNDPPDVRLLDAEEATVRRPNPNDS